MNERIGSFHLLGTVKDIRKMEAAFSASRGAHSLGMGQKRINTAGNASLNRFM